jgi:hypothetical protein
MLDYLKSICFTDKHFTVSLVADGGLDVIIDSFNFHDFDLSNDGILQFNSIKNDTNFSIDLNRVQDYAACEDGSFTVDCGSYKLSCEVI